MDATVNAGDIARLVDVGRAAVSNWRRRHEDFPQPVGGTASSPLFSLAEVEEWLRRNGKTFEVSPADRLWQRLRAQGDDLHLGERVAEAGRDVPPETFEYLCARYAEAHSRQLAVTPDDVAELMVRLAETKGRTVLDPACGLGTLLRKAGARQVRGQEINPTSAAIARIRLEDAEIVTGDSLRDNGFTEPMDAVVCDPPFHERAWGYDELIGDVRWEYGLPPRGEPELAWVQHCLSLTKPGGRVAILLPAAAASRRPGKRIRGNLLRAGAVIAVITVPGGRDIWLLRRPVPGEQLPSHVLLTGDVTETEPNTRIIDLLDDDVDLSPARHRNADTAAGFAEAAQRFHPVTPPDLQPRTTGLTTIGELIKTGTATDGVTVTSPTGATYVVDPDRLDPDFLAGVLRAALATTPTGSSRLDVRRTQVPRLPLAEQRAYGKAFRQLIELDQAAAQAGTLVRLGFEGLLGGRLGPR